MSLWSSLRWQRLGEDSWPWTTPIYVTLLFFRERNIFWKCQVVILYTYPPFLIIHLFFLSCIREGKIWAAKDISILSHYSEVARWFLSVSSYFLRAVEQNMWCSCLHVEGICSELLLQAAFTSVILAFKPHSCLCSVSCLSSRITHPVTHLHWFQWCCHTYFQSCS